MAEADAEDALAHGVERPEEGAEAEDPPLVAVRVVRAAAHHEPLVPPHLLRRRELAVDHPEAVPPLLLPSAAERRDEDVAVPAVHLPRVLRVVQRQQQRVPPHPYAAARRRRRHRHREEIECVCAGEVAGLSCV